MNDISSKHQYNSTDAKLVLDILKYEGTPQAIVKFSEVCDQLTDYTYWFVLSTLWVSYNGFTDLQLWKKLFSSDRPGREKSIMKPSEVQKFKQLPYFVTVYRAHRENETDWIAYTTDLETAFRFARHREVPTVSEYVIKKRDIIGYFLRRGEHEIIMLSPEKLRSVQVLDVPPAPAYVMAHRLDRAIFVEHADDGAWRMMPFTSLRKGMSFQLMEADGSIISDANGRTNFVATSDSYFGEDGWKVEIEDPHRPITEE